MTRSTFVDVEHSVLGLRSGGRIMADRLVPVRVTFKMVLKVPDGYERLSDYTDGNHCFQQDVIDYLDVPQGVCVLCGNLSIEETRNQDLVEEYKDRTNEYSLPIRLTPVTPSDRGNIWSNPLLLPLPYSLDFAQFQHCYRQLVSRGLQ